MARLKGIVRRAPLTDAEKLEAKTKKKFEEAGVAQFHLLFQQNHLSKSPNSGEFRGLQGLCHFLDI
jgi:hypothetical protein